MPDSEDQQQDQSPQPAPSPGVPELPAGPSTPEPPASAPVSACPPKDPPWSAWDVAMIAFAFVSADVVTMFVAVLVAMRYAHVGLQQAAYNAWLLVPVQLLAYVAGFIVMYVLVTRSYRRPFWHTVHWVWPKGMRAYLGLLAVGVPLAFATSYLEGVLPMPKQLPMEKFFRNPASAYLMAGLAILAAPFMEELFFRGFLYPVARRAGETFGILFTSAVFALVHGTQYGWSPTAVLLLLGVGLVLTIVRARTGSVAPGFLVHVGYNLTLFVLLFIATDHFRHLERAL